jgi:hypothetical protein
LLLLEDGRLKAEWYAWWGNEGRQQAGYIGRWDGPDFAGMASVQTMCMENRLDAAQLGDWHVQGICHFHMAVASAS